MNRRIVVACCVLGACVLGGRVLRRSVVDYFCVNGVSMEPTLLAGDCILVRKGGYEGAREAPPLGSVVVLRMDGGGYLVKRLIAGPGDTVAVQAGRLMVNGAALDEPFVAGGPAGQGVEAPGDWHFAFLLPEARTAKYVATAEAWGPLVVQEGGYFVLGDNRRHSGDSRSFGFVKAHELVGVPRRVVWSSEFRAAHLPRLRTGRIGAPL